MGPCVDTDHSDTTVIAKATAASGMLVVAPTAAMSRRTGRRVATRAVRRVEIANFGVRAEWLRCST